jgi:hypothetical protein
VLGGIVIYHGGHKVIIFEWGLGEATNNQVGALALYQELKLLDSRQIRNLVVIGCSTIFIKYMWNLSTLFECKLSRLISRFQSEVWKFDRIEFTHVLRDRNTKQIS